MRIIEIAASLYPWDLADEGVQVCLDNLQELSSVNTVYLVALMHYEKRPLTDYYYPHNPKRKTYFPEDSRVYWMPHEGHYKGLRIQPLTSRRDFLKGIDWLEVLIKEARKRGLRTGAEISHTILDRVRAREEFPDCIQRDIFGNRLGQLPCWNDEDARAYLLALVEDVCTNYDIDVLQSCLILFGTGHLPSGWGGTRATVSQESRSIDTSLEELLSVVLGGCFCHSCEKKAREKGLDWDGIKASVVRLAGAVMPGSDLGGPEAFHLGGLLKGSGATGQELLLEDPNLYAWWKFRCDSVTELMKDVQATVRKANSRIDFRYNTYIPHPEIAGLDLRAASAYMDSVRCSDYSEQSGSAEIVDTRKRSWLLNIRRQIGDDKKMISAIGIRPKATPELVRQGVIVSADCGCDGLSLGHYDGATFARLKAIREGMEMAEMELD